MADQKRAVAGRATRSAAPRPGAPPSAAAVQRLLETAAAAQRKGDKPAALKAMAAAIDLAATSRVQIPRSVFYDLGVLLLQAGDLPQAERRIRHGMQVRPGDFALTNLLGVVLKNQNRADEALALFKTAEKLNPASMSPVVNRGNIHLARRDGAAAVQAFMTAVRAEPDNAEHHRLLGAAFRLSGDSGAALAEFERARQLDPGNAKHWVDPAGLLDELGRNRAALSLVESGLAVVSNQRPLAEAKLALLRRAGEQRAAVAYARALVQRFPDQAWVHQQFGRCVMHVDRPLANRHLRQAVKLEPQNADALTELADSLDRTRGPDEGKRIEEAYGLALQRLKLGANMLPHARIISSILNRACNFAAAATVGSFEQLTDHWADTGYISALHYQMAQVRTDAQRRRLLEAHRRWGKRQDAIAAGTPLAHPTVRRGRAKLRIGLMSSDLRNHPVTYFVLPFIENYDRAKYELYCYSWNSGKADPVQYRIAALADAFRLAPAIGDRDAAALIAADNVDILIELGGTTYMNKLNVMCWRPARVQASWLGYPHSAGPETIDYILVDPYNRPVDDAWLIEKPLVLPRSWVVLGNLGFHDRIAIEPGTPESRNGYITFGTMNNPYKFNEALIATWAEVLRAVPESRFLFVRPESANSGFRENVQATFAAHGVAAERINFVAVRGRHMPHYNKIDIALDSFPQTGGTTTCEALWMGVPTVSLVGPCFFERLSHSNLTNAGLADLCVADRAAYVRKAVELAADPKRRAALRESLRSDIRARPLGRVDWFVDDFQATLASAVHAGPARRVP